MLVTSLLIVSVLCVVHTPQNLVLIFAGALASPTRLTGFWESTCAVTHIANLAAPEQGANKAEQATNKDAHKAGQAGNNGRRGLQKSFKAFEKEAYNPVASPLVSSSHSILRLVFS